jgi:uncharacterized metal-binding protein YceD (DUF177 family)
MDALKDFAIHFKGLKAGEHEFEYKLDKAFLEAVGDEEMVDAEVVANVVMTKAASMLTFKVSLDGTAIVECDRCLDELEYPIQTEDMLFVKFSEEEFEFDGEVMWLNPADEEINLADYIYESLLLALPYQRVHEDIEDCNPEMINRFSIVSEEEFDEIAEPKEQSLAGGESGAKLAALKQSLEAQEKDE